MSHLRPGSPSLYHARPRFPTVPSRDSCPYRSAPLGLYFYFFPLYLPTALRARISCRLPHGWSPESLPAPPNARCSARGGSHIIPLSARHPRTTRVLLYTYATQRPIGERARSLHVGTPAYVYTLPTAGSPTYARVGRYTTVPARALYTWAHPPTCAPYTAVRLTTSARAPFVILQCSPSTITPKIILALCLY